MTSVLTLDGTAYPNLHVTSLKRSFAVLDGDNAGRVMTGAMVRDIIGTFYNYSVELDPVGTDPAEYDRFYEAISTPEGAFYAFANIKELGMTSKEVAIKLLDEVQVVTTPGDAFGSAD